MGSSTGLEPGDLFRLAQIACNIAERHDCSISEAVDILEKGGQASAPPQLDHMVRVLKQFRARRNQAMGSPLFRDPAWDMLLDLFLIEDDCRPMTVTGLCLGSGVAPTTALRHLQRLSDSGFLVREDDHHDHRRSFLRLTERKRAMLAEFLMSWQAAMAGGAASGREARRGNDRQSGRSAGPASHPVFLS